jgi:hypothetical protein
MANTCRHGRPSTITCDFCRAESRGNDIRASGRETPPRWRVPKPQQIGAPVCRDCKPFVVFSAWGDLYAHLQGHIDAANGGPSIPTFKPDEPDMDDRNSSAGQLKPKITDADKAKLQALLDTTRSKPIDPHRSVIVRPINNDVHAESHTVKSTRMSDRILKASLILGGAIALFGIAFSALIIFKVPSSYYMPWNW